MNTARKHRALVLRLARTMHKIDRALSAARYDTKRTKRGPYEEYRWSVLEAQAQAAINVVRGTK